MFEKATRLKLRFNFKGLCTVEDLWDLSLEDLNSVFQGLNSQLKEHKEESLLDKKTQNEELLELTVNIVKYIFETKQKEQKEREDAIAKAERKQKILGIIANKQDAELQDKSIDELNKLVDEL
jgi:hypothetical protein